MSSERISFYCIIALRFTEVNIECLKIRDLKYYSKKVFEKIK